MRIIMCCSKERNAWTYFFVNSEMRYYFQTRQPSIIRNEYLSQKSSSVQMCSRGIFGQRAWFGQNTETNNKRIWCGWRCHDDMSNGSQANRAYVFLCVCDILGFRNHRLKYENWKELPPHVHTKALLKINRIWLTDIWHSQSAAPIFRFIMYPVCRPPPQVGWRHWRGCRWNGID